MIPSTHLSILEALKDTGLREAAWERFQSRYRETILRWFARRGLQPADAEDVTQAVLLRLYQSLPKHAHDPARPFRSWLKAVVGNALRDRHRAERRRPGDRGAGGSSAQERLTQLATTEGLDELAEAMEGPGDPDLDAAVERVRARVDGTTWQAFWLVVVDGLSVADVAAQLEMSTGSVYQAKYRVCHMLAEEYPAEK